MKITTKQIREMIRQELEEFKAPEMDIDIDIEAPTVFKYTPNKSAAQKELLRQVEIKQ